MDFVNSVLVRLADPATRDALFDQVSLEHIVAGTYDSSFLTIEGPFTTVFEQFELGFSVQPRVVVDGGWQPGGGGEMARLEVFGLGHNTEMFAEARWQGGIVARVSHTVSRITSVTSTWPALFRIDREIIDDLGALPDDPAALEAARRARLLALLRAGMAQPDALTDAALDGWLRDNHAASVGELLRNIAGNLLPAALRVAIADDPLAPTSPLFLPIAAPVFIRAADVSLARLLADTRTLLEVMRQSGYDPARDARLVVRHSVIAVWIVPISVFDDDDWPGATAAMNQDQRRTARRMAAGAWLADAGIGLVAVAGA